MSKTSAGILLYRRENNILHVFLIHPGGPFFAKKDAGIWSIPKGEIDAGEDPLDAALREFEEETGCRPAGDFIPLTPVTQKGGKTVIAWAAKGGCNAETIRSNTFSLEWPPRSGTTQEFPEVDRAGWFGIDEAKEKLHPAQVALVDELMSKLTS